MWKKVVGWILFVWGAGGFIGDMVFIGRLKSNPSTLVPNLIFCALFMWGGWMLTHSKKEKHK
jgi:predicted MFS family arabinose efflux permease